MNLKGLENTMVIAIQPCGLAKLTPPARRRQEQEGIIRRQQEAEAAANEARRHIVTGSTPANQPRVDVAGYQRRSQEPSGPPPPSSTLMPVAAPRPSRPPSSSRTYNDQYNGFLPPAPQSSAPKHLPVGCVN